MCVSFFSLQFHVQDELLLIIVLSLMKIVEESFIGLILPLFAAQMLNSLICRQAIGEVWVSIKQSPAPLFKTQSEMELRMLNDRSFCGVLPAPGFAAFPITCCCRNALCMFAAAYSRQPSPFFQKLFLC